LRPLGERFGLPAGAVASARPLTGNEAIARGAWEAGVKVAAAYPGTPSTEILESLATYPAEDLHAQWSTNEKVALDVAMGASFAGRRALAAMKHVGLNVAADAFMSLTYIGVNAGLVPRHLRRSGHPQLAERAGHPALRRARRRARA
jgi:indolepyruvate ferredoxin oxidoreductase alpha subunit